MSIFSCDEMHEFCEHSPWPDHLANRIADLGDFPCTYCRGMTQHDPACQLLVIRLAAELLARVKSPK